MHQLFVNHLTNIDFTYFDPARGLVGETLLVDIELLGNLNTDNMLLDFAEVKSYLKNKVEALFDHKFVVPKQQSTVRVINNFDRIGQVIDQVSVTLYDHEGLEYRHTSPSEGVYLAPIECVTITQLNQLLMDHIEWSHPDLALRISLRPECISGAYYHYSHGLKQHQGACQRIAHGHRSQLFIFINGQRQQGLETSWAQQWQDIYLGCSSDIGEIVTLNNESYHRFDYMASEGRYSLQVPSKKVHILPASSTVECIAEYIAQRIDLETTHQHLSVQAFEGVNKGAVYEVHS